MPREFYRSDRVSAQIQRELAGILQKEIKNPEFGLVTLNAVKVTRDLSLAKVYFSILKQDNNAVQRSIHVLNELAPLLRHQLCGKMRIRNIPELRFVFDESLERGRRIERLLEGLEPPESESK